MPLCVSWKDNSYMGEAEGDLSYTQKTRHYEPERYEDADLEC